MLGPRCWLGWWIGEQEVCSCRSLSARSWVIFSRDTQSAGAWGFEGLPCSGGVQFNLCRGRNLARVSWFLRGAWAGALLAYSFNPLRDIVRAPGCAVPVLLGAATGLLPLPQGCLIAVCGTASPEHSGAL